MRLQRLVLTQLTGAVLAIPTERRSTSISSIIAFGDELSDNGNGSYSHGLTGNPANVYGYGTWTNGPVAVSYLADELGVPLAANYAFGGCCGGAKSGATLDSTYTPSDAGAPSLQDQIQNFTSSISLHEIDPQGVLAFIWIGQNDASKHTDAFWLEDPMNQQFSDNLTDFTVDAVRGLIDLGISNVLVANMYPKHIAPVTSTYLCDGSDNTCTQTWGQIIQKANDNLKSSLATNFGDQVIYYDSFKYISDLADDAQAYGFTQPLGKFCDGQGDASWDACMTTSRANDGSTEITGWNSFFWMTFQQMTTRVHELVGRNMADVVRQALGT